MSLTSGHQKTWNEYSENELEQVIRQMHCEDKISLREIAKQLKTYPVKVMRFCRKHDIETLSSGESLQAGYKSNRLKSPRKGVPLDEETKLKISEAIHNNWNSMDDTEREKRCEIQREIFANRKDKKSFSIKGCQAIRKAVDIGSKLERELIQYFEENKVDYRHHFKGLFPNTKLEVDFYLPEYNLVLEVDGPSHFKDNLGIDAFRKQMDADNKKNGLVLQMGLSILRLGHTRTLYKRDHRKIIEYLDNNLGSFNNEVRRVNVEEL